ncbi:putative secreted protein (Por secretion system target) [Lacinutrix venerupis]|uniref:S8 family serine peptidase n=1 Tax=Lacinutrix venerupis TaxID=1486034 RepID=UPI000EAEDB2C|nr:S8 family serine peptidase [Lacinutrix venerupis]RLJ62525.1 putative secreted protein (Por secretion system target) [Lacinutrix venerupis]
MFRNIICFVFLLFQLNSLAQEDAWVYLLDKENVQTSIANPISILTQKAIDRKAAHNIPIDERDVPVNENYISQLKTQTGITVLAKSKWFNAVHVRGLETDINALENLAFVDEIIFADDSLNARTENTNTSSPASSFKTENAQVIFDYGNALNQIQMFNGDQLHISDYTGTGMTVAVIDSGFPGVDVIAGFQRVRDSSHILGTYDFVNRDIDVYNNTSSNHGTLVLSDMVGYIENDFVGTAPDAEYYLFITEHAPNENPVEESYWVEAVERADSLGVDVVNTSLGYKDYDNTNYSHTDADLDGLTTYISKGANIAFEKGMLMVTSAGNSGANGVSAPGDAPGSFTIAAVDSNENYASFSSQGSAIQLTQKPDVAAQGQGSYVISQSGAISTANGTSFSSPIMAGGIVCLWQALPDFTNAEIMQLVRETASQYNNPDYFLGYGIPDLSLALAQGLSVQDFPETTTDLIVYPNPVKNNLFIKLPTAYETGQITLYDVIGKKVLESAISQTNNKVNVSSFSKGVYLLKVEAAGLAKTLKLVVN